MKVAPINASTQKFISGKPMATIWTSSASAAVVIFSKQEVKTELNNAVTVALITSVKAKVTTAFNHPSNQLLMGGNMSEQINSGPNPGGKRKEHADDAHDDFTAHQRNDGGSRGEPIEL